MEIWKLVNILSRGFAFLWTVLVMALTGNMINDWNHGNGGIVNYSLFVSVFGMLTLLFLIPASVKEAWGLHPLLPLLLDLLNVIFWFCGAVAFAAEIGAHSCGNQSYLHTNGIMQGSSKRCHESQATTAFLWFGWAAFTFSCIYSGMAARGGANVRPSGIRRSGPAMSQV
ncbi:hypothetical protein M433DRAFT_150298 [Acidomyces richmondensis BFW]|nr:MAG: hypothetical protein FE78DRAFT_92947 [Acidomyces sp. 'richmondensis']KYG49139.1 hypothetical protein M433DRAFT_150298 [Acidomyces richmondensis BFW]